MSWYLSVDKCDTHDAYNITLNSRHAQTTSGVRLSTRNCCGRSREMERFELTAKQMRNIAIEFECAAEQAEQEEDDS